MSRDNWKIERKYKENEGIVVWKYESANSEYWWNWRDSEENERLIRWRQYHWELDYTS